MNSEPEIYAKFMKAWGKSSQLGMLQEECAELIVAVNKYFRNIPQSDEMICEELADVQNMINQFKGLYPKFEEIRIEKLKRAEKLLEVKDAKIDR
jgi:NTP pyrophosphatase (non-canonical NTP hydrolase)